MIIDGWLLHRSQDDQLCAKRWGQQQPTDRIKRNPRGSRHVKLNAGFAFVSDLPKQRHDVFHGERLCMFDFDGFRLEQLNNGCEFNPLPGRGVGNNVLRSKESVKLGLATLFPDVGGRWCGVDSGTSVVVFAAWFAKN